MSAPPAPAPVARVAPWRAELDRLLAALAGELADAAAAGADPAGVAAIAGAVAWLRDRLPDESFGAAQDAYTGLCARKAATLNAVAEVASSHASMEEFWLDAGLQEAGESRRGYWDTYEHGRRRQLEAIVADAYGAPGAVLVNTGMSALDVALGAAGLRPGDRLLVHERAYFETTEYLDTVLSRGVETVRCDLGDAGAVHEALADGQVRAVLAETALNSMPCTVPAGLEAVVAAGRLLIVDNSYLSHAVPLFGLYPDGRLLVAESAIKYLTGSCSAGVLYGRGDDLAATRRYARRFGQQLQERAFNHLQIGELTGAGPRVRRHGAAADRFRAALDPGPWDWIRQVTDGLGDRRDRLAAAVRAAGPGALLFARLPGDDATTAAAHRAVIARWCALAGAEGTPVPVHAGFGWTRTSVRSYESDRLNQPDAPTFIRISVGLEPDDDIRRLAVLLDRAVHEVGAP